MLFGLFFYGVVVMVVGLSLVVIGVFFCLIEISCMLDEVCFYWNGMGFEILS